MSKEQYVGETAYVVLGKYDVVQDLACAPIFSVLSEGELDALVTSSEISNVPAGTRLMEQGLAEDFAYYVISGTIAIEVDNGSGPVVVGTITDRNIVGEIGAFTSSTRMASARAQTECTLLRIDRSAIRTILLNNPDLTQGIILELGSRIAQLNDAVAMLTRATETLSRESTTPEVVSALARDAKGEHHFETLYQQLIQEIRSKGELHEEMRLASRIQQSLLPDEIADGQVPSRFDIAGMMLPAQHVGGDFFDFFLVDENTLVFAVGDVSGKGVPAALLMSVSRTALRAIAPRSSSAAAVLQDLNTQLVEQNKGDYSFVAVACGILKLDTGDLSIAAGGLGDVYIVGDDRRARHLSATGPAMGIIKESGIEEHVLNLNAGDYVVFTSDGVSEAQNGKAEMFRRPNIMNTLDCIYGESSECVLRHLVGQVDAFVDGAPQADDLTVLSLRFRADIADGPCREDLKLKEHQRSV